MGGIHALNKAEQDFINQWEADAFRKKLASGLPRYKYQFCYLLGLGGGSKGLFLHFGAGHNIVDGLA